MESGKKLGENLRKLRLKKNMSQGDLATALSVDRAYISNIENGRMNPLRLNSEPGSFSDSFF